MSAPGATKGPWVVAESAIDVGAWEIGTGHWDGMFFSEYNIATAQGWYHAAHADACLIAASPELYDACEVAFDFLGSIDGAAEVRDTLLSAMLAARGEAA